VCPTVYQPACGTDGEKYDNECLLRTANCNEPDEIIGLDLTGACLDESDEENK